MLIGDKAMECVKNAKIAVFGIGGVGGYVVEALVRSGVEYFDLIDADIVEESNMNRQIIATTDTIGKYKVDAMKERIRVVNPNAVVNLHKCFFLPEKSSEFDFSKYTYIVDAVDTVTAKIELAVRASEAGVPIISSMGTGNKLDPQKFQVADVYKTSMCPLARVMRRELRKRGIKKLKVVYSTEKPKKLFGGLFQPKEYEEYYDYQEERYKSKPVRKDTPGSIAFVPSVAGLIMASEIVRDIIKADGAND